MLQNRKFQDALLTVHIYMNGNLLLPVGRWGMDVRGVVQVARSFVHANHLELGIQN